MKATEIEKKCMRQIGGTYGCLILVFQKHLTAKEAIKRIREIVKE